MDKNSVEKLINILDKFSSSLNDLIGRLVKQKIIKPENIATRLPAKIRKSFGFETAGRDKKI